MTDTFRSFGKTPGDLGINQAEFDALVKVLRMLESGNIASDAFGMGHVDSRRGHCIAGWARIVSMEGAFDRPVFPYWFTKKGLRRLFYPNVGNWGRIGTAEAAAAIRNYLNTGEPRWQAVLV